MSEATEELDDTERTTEELAEVLAMGGMVSAYLAETLTVHVTLADVSLSVRYPLNEQATAELLSGLPQGHLHLELPSTHLETITTVESGEIGLLDRALTARATLINPATPPQEHTA